MQEIIDNVKQHRQKYDLSSQCLGVMERAGQYARIWNTHYKPPTEAGGFPEKKHFAEWPDLPGEDYTLRGRAKVGLPALAGIQASDYVRSRAPTPGPSSQRGTPKADNNDWMDFLA